MNKVVFRIGLLTYLVLGILAYVFYLERTAFLDIAFHLFYIIKDGFYAIQNNRFGAVFTQTFPLLGSKVKLDLNSIMKLYSLGFVIYYAGIFTLCIKVFKSYKYALSVLLLSILMVTDTFYWIQSELPQGLAFLLLYFSFWTYFQKNGKFSKWWVQGLNLVFIIFIVFFHPLIVFPFGFIIAFQFISNPAYRKGLFIISVLFFSVLVIKTLFFKTEYDSTSMSGLKNFITLFPNYLNLQSNKNLVEYAVKDYYLLFILWLVCCIYYLKIREYLKLALLLAFFTGYIAMVNISYPNDIPQFYIENLYLPISIFVIIPFVFDLSKTLNKTKLSTLLVVIVLFRLVHIAYAHKPYSDRVSYLESYLLKTDTLPQKKLLLNAKPFPLDTLMMTWGSPYEFWLLSTIKDNESRSIIISEDPKSLSWINDYNTRFLTTWGAFEYDELPAQYFIFKDSSYYKIVE